MCGIAGFCLNPKSHERLPEPSKIAAALLEQIEARGTDSTGAAWAPRAFKRINLHKRAVRAREFIKQGRTDLMQDDTMTAVLHTRMATQGSPRNNLNNHPILQGPVVGVHNGHLSNDDELFKQLRVARHGEVDSEAAFALIAHGKGAITERLPMLRGRAALAWMDRRDASRGPVLHLARVSDSPLVIGQTKGGSFMFASTRPLLNAACASLNVDLVWQEECDEGTYLQVQEGKVTTFDTFTVPRPWSRNVYTIPTRTGSGTTRRWTPQDIDEDDMFLDGEWIDDDTFIPYP